MTPAGFIHPDDGLFDRMPALSINHGMLGQRHGQGVEIIQKDLKRNLFGVSGSRRKGQGLVAFRKAGRVFDPIFLNFSGLIMEGGRGKFRSGAVLGRNCLGAGSLNS